jgi:neutral ceramidase
MGNETGLAHLAQLLKSLGIRPGETLLIEAPGPALGEAPGELDGLLAAIRQVVGASGDIAAPACTASEGQPKPVFDPLLSPSESGPFSEFFRRQPGVVRSHNPTHSVAAQGPGAGAITAGHRAAFGRQTPWGEASFGYGSAWDALAERDAWWVMVGAGWADSPFLAYVQAVYAERHAGITKETPYPRLSGAALASALEEMGTVRTAEWHGQTVAVFRLREALAAGLDLLEREPGRLRPDREFTLWLDKVRDLQQNGYLRAGVAKVKITPPIPCRRWDGKEMVGVHRDLYARIVVLSRGSRYAALVVCDLLGIAHRLVEDIRERTFRRTGFPPDAIMVACTHSHSTPDTIGSGNEDPAYLEVMVEGIADGLSRAVAGMEPVRLGWGRAPIRGLAHSRRIKMPDGRVYTTRYGVPSTWRVDPERIAGQGAINPDVTVARLETLSGEVRAVIANFGCHASVALLSRELSGDYPGEAMHALESALGGQAVALCTNGTAADVDPTLEMPVWGPRNDANALRLGRIYAAQVLELLERAPVGDEASIGAARCSVELPVRADWKRLVQAEPSLLRQEFASANPASQTLAQIIREGVVHSEVQVLRLNELCLVGLPGEVMTSTGLKLQKDWPNAAVVELANDTVGYILTPEAESEGGYETGLHLWTRTTARGEAVLLEAAANLLKTTANS